MNVLKSEYIYIIYTLYSRYILIIEIVNQMYMKNHLNLSWYWYPISNYNDNSYLPSKLQHLLSIKKCAIF